ncbi:MAG TPA: type I-F CRISPR-associated protein Csy2 [Hydrogenophilus thermoluteolus]|nr:type I-F CRISPR-associated protein Csy2 [Hydrogenophilus thermoluteolus]HNU20383.1 type I-F CRISPR-associated protein Csy2 [Hydrogenophilus thermoluteolus]
MTDTCALIWLKHVRVENANAISGNFLWGFPSPSAFLGFAHALERRLNSVKLGGVGIVCHRLDPQVSHPDGPFRPGRFRLARHPYIAGWKKFKNEPAALIEEGKAHLEITLVLEVRTELDEGDRQALAQEMRSIVPSLRLAGGSIRGCTDVQVIEWPEWEEDQRKAFRKLRYRLLPGFALVERQDRLEEHLQTLCAQNPETTPLEAFLDLLARRWEPSDTDENTGKCRWQIRPRPGWLVPIAVGYAALSELYREVAASRDPNVPFRFVESLYTVGEWVSPHRLTRLEQLFWRFETDLEKGLYLCRNRYIQAKETPNGND